MLTRLLVYGIKFYNDPKLAIYVDNVGTLLGGYQLNY